jgi:hypothetical protein
MVPVREKVREETKKSIGGHVNLDHVKVGSMIYIVVCMTNSNNSMMMYDRWYYKTLLGKRNTKKAHKILSYKSHKIS